MYPWAVFFGAFVEDPNGNGDPPPPPPPPPPEPVVQDFPSGNIVEVGEGKVVALSHTPTTDILVRWSRIVEANTFEEFASASADLTLEIQTRPASIFGAFWRTQAERPYSAEVSGPMGSDSDSGPDSVTVSRLVDGEPVQQVRIVVTERSVSVVGEGAAQSQANPDKIEYEGEV